MLQINQLPDNEIKLRRLEEVAAKVQAVPGSEARTLAESIETMRDLARSGMSESAQTPNAQNMDEGQQLKDIVERGRANLKAAQDAAEAARVANEKRREDAAKVNTQLHSMIGFYSKAQICADNNLVYNEAKVSALQQAIKKYIEINRISRDQTDQAWVEAQISLANPQIFDIDCDQLGWFILGTFGDHVFNLTIEKSPF